MGTAGVEVAEVTTVSHETDLSRSQAAWSWNETLVVVCLQIALVGVIYRHTLQLAFLSDAWVYLANLRDGVWTTLTTPIGYHYQPVACAWIALIRALFGERPAVFQAVNIGEVAALGYLTYALGRRLLNDNVAAFLASLLLIGNAAFYEIAYWPLAGNMHFLAALLYVLAVIIACDLARGGLGRSGPWLLAVTVLAAIFTHPATTTAVPVCGLTLLLLGDRTGDRIGFGDTRAQKLLALGLLAAVAMLFGLTRLSFTSEFSSGPQPGIDSMRAYWLVSRGIVAVVSLRGSHEVVHRLITLGSYAGFDTPAIWWYVGGWLTVTSIALLVVFWRTRTSGVRVLVVFFATHLVGPHTRRWNGVTREPHPRGAGGAFDGLGAAIDRGADGRGGRDDGCRRDLSARSRCRGPAARRLGAGRSPDRGGDKHDLFEPLSRIGRADPFARAARRTARSAHAGQHAGDGGVPGDRRFRLLQRSLRSNPPDVVRGRHAGAPSARREERAARLCRGHRARQPGGASDEAPGWVPHRADLRDGSFWPQAAHRRRPRQRTGPLTVPIVVRPRGASS